MTKPKGKPTIHEAVCEQAPVPAAAGPPCELCLTLEAYHIRKAELQAEIDRALAPAREVTCEMDRAIQRLFDYHPKCKWCGIMVGGLHLAQRLSAEGLCEDCAERKAGGKSASHGRDQDEDLPRLHE